jgi:hypothetical protein
MIFYEKISSHISSCFFSEFGVKRPMSFSRVNEVYIIFVKLIFSFDFVSEKNKKSRVPKRKIVNKNKKI